MLIKMLRDRRYGWDNSTCTAMFFLNDKRRKTFTERGGKLENMKSEETKRDNALDGDEEQEWEFKMMFADLCAECEQMQEDLRDTYIPECFNDLFVAAGAGSYGGGLLGWNSYEQNYFGIEIGQGLEETESTKRLKRLTKEQLIECVQKCLKIFCSYVGIRHRYDCLKAALDILRDENTGYLQIVKQIEGTYERANSDGFYCWKESTKELDRLADCMPALAWIQ